jgi:hypothetical protein
MDLMQMWIADLGKMWVADLGKIGFVQLYFGFWDC